MASLYIDRRNVEVRIDAGALVIHDQGVRIATVPLAPIERVVLRGSATLQASVLGKLGDAGVGVLILSGRKGRATLFFGRPHGDASLRVAQIRLSLDSSFCVDYARYLVCQKLQHQLDWLARIQKRRPQARLPLVRAAEQMERLRLRIAEVRRTDTLRGIEGAAARAYFGALAALVPAGLAFSGRNRRPPRDPFNALLSLTYTLVHAEVAFALHSAGLDPCVGYYHELAYSRESLASDVLEPLRPLADRFCLRLVASQTLVADHFSTTATGCLLGKAGRTLYYRTYEEHAPRLRRAIQQEVARLRQLIRPQQGEPDITRLSESVPEAHDLPHE